MTSSKITGRNVEQIIDKIDKKDLGRIGASLTKWNGYVLSYDPKAEKNQWSLIKLNWFQVLARKLGFAYKNTTTANVLAPLKAALKEKHANAVKEGKIQAVVSAVWNDNHPVGGGTPPASARASQVVAATLTSTLPGETEEEISPIGKQLDEFREIEGCKIFSEEEEQVEVGLNGTKVGPDTETSPWKLHISANPENAAQVLEAVRVVLLKNRPHFKFIKNEELLQEYNTLVNSMFPERGHFKEGKFITIYGASDEEVKQLAKELDEALRKAVAQGQIEQLEHPAVNRTDRPIGDSGFLWARHDQAGSPITNVDFKEGTHAAAAEGNYRTIIHFPINWAFDETPEKMEIKIQNKDAGVEIVERPDIFAGEWGEVHWNSEKRVFEGLLE